MKTRRIIGITVVAIVAILLYASVWTSENSISVCFFLSSTVLIMQSAATAVIIEYTGGLN